MRAFRGLLCASTILAIAAYPSVSAGQEPAPQYTFCRERPCAVVVDWTQAGGVGNQAPDRRYGNPVQLEERVKNRLRERGFERHGSTDSDDLRFVLIPVVRPAMCDELPGTASAGDARGFRTLECRAILEIETRIEGPSGMIRDIELPTRLRNRCPSDQAMDVERLSVFVADWIIYAVEGKSKGQKRPVARCR